MVPTPESAPLPKPVAVPQPIPTAKSEPIAKSEPARQPEPPRSSQPVASQTKVSQPVAPVAPARETRPQKAVLKADDSYSSYDESGDDRFLGGMQDDSSYSESYDDVAAELLRASIAEDEALSRPAVAKPVVSPTVPKPQPATASKPLPIKADPSTPAAAPVSSSVPLTISAADLWTQVLVEMKDVLRSQAKVASRTVFIGPAKLEVTFPRRYNFGKSYCEKPDTLRRIEEIACRIAGQPVKLSLVLSEDEPAADSSQVPAEAGRIGAKNNRRAYNPEEDDFVFNVMNVFGAQVVKVEPLVAAVRRAEDAE